MAIEKCSKCGEEYDTLYSSHSCKNEAPKPLGFGWGNFWIIIDLISCTLSALGLIFFGLIIASSEGLTGGIVIYLSISLLFDGLFIGSAIGLIKRKKWALYLTYVFLALGTIGIVIKAIEESYSYLLLLVISFLWFKYFYRRRSWFK